MPIYIRKCAKCHGVLSEEDTAKCPHCGTVLIETGVEVEETSKCPECGEEMENKGMKDNQVETQIGNLKIERDYYYCPKCKQGIFPPG